jgi:dTMP kinase
MMSADSLKRLKGKYLVFDGIDGAGKGAQLSLLTKQLSEHGIETVMARDPGGTPVGDRIRHVLLDYDLSAMDIRCETFLFMASRAQLVKQVIAPALMAGKTCLGDRFVSATCAYQGAAGFDARRIVELARFAIDDVWPQLTIVLDVPVSAGLERTKRPVNAKRGESGGDRHPTLFHDVHPDAMESRPIDFHKRVRELFLELPKFYPAPVAVVDGVGTVDQVQARVMETIARAAL